MELPVKSPPPPEGPGGTSTIGAGDTGTLPFDQPPTTPSPAPTDIGTSQSIWQRLRAIRARHPVIAFLVRRVGAGLLTLLVASFLIFLAVNALPGDVSRAVLGQNATPELVANLNQELGLDQPLFSRYVDWLGGVLTGDLGESAVAVAQGNPTSSVWSLISTPLANSIMLAVITIVLLVPLVMLLGTLMAVRAGTSVDYTLGYPMLIVGALPEFVFGTLLIAIFFNGLNWFSPVAIVPPDESPFAYADTLVLPVLTLLGILLAYGTRQVRAGVRATLQEPYVTVARLSGIRESRVLWRYALRNSLAPSVQTFAQSFQYLFGGIIVVELLFAYPGIGQTLVQAVTARDVTEVQSITLILAALFMALNIIADLIVVLMVPKLRTGLQ